MNKFLGIAALAATVSLQAAVVCEVKEAKDLSLPDRVEKTGEKQFKVLKLGWFTSAKKYPIDPKKSYRIQCELRTVSGETVKGKASIGFYSVDAKGRVINVSNVFTAEGSETELAAPVNVGDKVFKIKDASKWKTPGGYVALDIDPSGKMRDLPCFSVCNNPITKITKNSDVWDVEVNAPVRTAYGAGVPVRQHLPGWSYLSCSGVAPSSEWQKLEWMVKPGAVKGNTRTQWLFGAEKFIIVMVLPAGVEFRNVTVEDID